MVFSNLASSQKSPESGVLQEQVGETLSSAMTTAALALTAKERTLLRLHFLEGMTLDELARTYASHASTVSRWLTDAKEHFLTVVRDEIGERSGMGRLAVDSLVRTMHGKLDISLRTALGD
jgi:RNA polymerase sigma-70 factor (ECF subfamily)